MGAAPAIWPILSAPDVRSPRPLFDIFSGDRAVNGRGAARFMTARRRPAVFTGSPGGPPGNREIASITTNRLAEHALERDVARARLRPAADMRGRRPSHALSKPPADPPQNAWPVPLFSLSRSLPSPTFDLPVQILSSRSTTCRLAARDGDSPATLLTPRPIIDQVARSALADSGDDAGAWAPV